MRVSEIGTEVAVSGGMIAVTSLPVLSPSWPWQTRRAGSRDPHHPAGVAHPSRRRSTFTRAPPFLQLGTLLALDDRLVRVADRAHKQDFDFARSGLGQWKRLTGSGYRFDDNDRY